MERQVVITGIGAITPCGKGHDALWEAVSSGRSSARVVDRWAQDGMPIRIAAEVQNFDIREFVDTRAAFRLDRSAQFALAAATLAVRDSELAISPESSHRCGVIDGTDLGPTGLILDRYRRYVTGESTRANPTLLVTGKTGNSSAAISMTFGLHGASNTISHGCVSSSSAIGWGFRLIRDGSLELVIAGGTEAPLHQHLVLPLFQSGVLSRQNDDPENACKPYSPARDGFVVGEGAVYLILEEIVHARSRGAPVYCELAGFAENSDAYHPTSPDPDGTMMALAITTSLRQAAIQPEDVDYVNLHATATSAGDQAESRSIERVFGAMKQQPLMSGTKPVTGHLLGACGATEAAIAALSIDRQFVPPTRTTQTLDPSCPVNLVVRGGIAARIESALSINASFGGRNTCLTFKQTSEAQMKGEDNVCKSL